MDLQYFVSHILCVWVTSIVVFISYAWSKGIIAGDFFNVGPNDNFILFNITINTYSKYFLVIVFCFLNSCIRKLDMNILQPWITVKVQNNITNKRQSSISKAFIVSNISGIYVWIDFIIYMNLLFSQIDVVLVEIVADVLILNLSTYYYMFNLKHSMSKDVNIDSSIFYTSPTSTSSPISETPLISSNFPDFSRFSDYSSISSENSPVFKYMKPKSKNGSKFKHIDNRNILNSFQHDIDEFYDN